MNSISLCSLLATRPSFLLPLPAVDLAREAWFVKVSDRRMVEVSRLEEEWQAGSFSLGDLHVILHDVMLCFVMFLIDA